jgi:fructokinase
LLDHNPQVFVIGESITDIVVRDGVSVDHPGGSPLNVSFGVSRLGLGTTFLTRLGDDPAGLALEQHLVAAGVVVVPQPLPGVRSATAQATIDTTGSASYLFDIDWQLPRISLEQVAVGGDTATVVHFGSIGAFLEPGASEVEALIAAAGVGSLVTYDPNIRPQLIGSRDAARRRVESHLRLSDLVKASDEDIEWLYPGANPREIAQSWLELGPSVVVVTRGSEGSFALGREGISAELPSRKVTLVDTIGAGDSFMAGLIFGLVNLAAAHSASEGDSEGDSDTRRRVPTFSANDLATLLDIATACGAITVSRAGAMPPTYDELQAGR